MRGVVVPSLAPGAHKSELRRALMQEARRRVEGSAGGASRSWLGVLAQYWYAPALLVLAVAIGIWAYFQPPGRPTDSSFATTRGATTSESGRGISAALGVDGSQTISPREATQLASAIREAIAMGRVHLLQSLTASTGGTVFLYDVDLADGRQVTYASDHVLPTNQFIGRDHAQFLEQAIAQESGRYVSEAITGSGARVYRYRTNLADGTEEIYGSDREVDPGKHEAHRKELSRAIAQSRGELYKAVFALDGKVMFIVRVVLSDGAIKTYASPSPPSAK